MVRHQKSDTVKVNMFKKKWSMQNAVLKIIFQNIKTKRTNFICQNIFKKFRLISNFDLG